MPGRVGRPVFIALVLVLVASAAGNATGWVRTTASDGFEGFAARQWHDSELLAFLAELPEDVTIYTNGPDALYIHTGRRARYLPARIDPGTRAPKPGYERALEEVIHELRQENAMVAWFDLITWRRYRASPAELGERMPLRRTEKLRDGSIWVHPKWATPAQ